MKGYKKDGKFRPTEKRYTKNSLKKKDLYKKSLSSPSGSGHEMRAKKTMEPISVTSEHFSMDFSHDGNLEHILIHEDGFVQGADDSSEISSALFRAMKSDISDEFAEEFDKHGDYEKLKKTLIKNLEDDPINAGLYEVSGDNRRWDFRGDEDEEIENEFYMFFQDNDYSEEEQEEIESEFYTQYEPLDFDKFVESRDGKQIIDELKEKINSSKSLAGLFDVLTGERFSQGVAEDTFSNISGEIITALDKTVEKLQKDGTIKGNE